MHEPLSWFGLPAYGHNVLAMLLTFAYVFSVPPVLDYLVTKKGLSREISRKITHIAAGSVVAFLPLFIDEGWSRYLNVAVFVLWALLFVQKGLFAAPGDQALKTMTRTGDRRELLRGTLSFALVGILCGTLWYKEPAGVLAMAMLGWGDGIAPIVGGRYGRHPYHVLSDKSVEGSIAFFVGSVLAGLLFMQLVLPKQLDPGMIALVALFATVAEGVSPRETDNILVPATVIAATLIF